MKQNRLVYLLMVCLVPALVANKSVGQGTTINKWYSSRLWLHGANRDPAGSINKREFARQYNLHKAWWDSAFSYIAHADLSALKPGRYNLYGNEDVYINVTETTPKNKEDVLFELHRLYADIHCVVQGEEMIGIAASADARLKTAYDSARDIAFYTTSKGKFYRSDAHTLFIMFPGKDAHCGGIKTTPGQAGVIRKVVVKVRCR